ncbi:hypothetical protein MishRS11D_12060 [Methylomagnum ishizawai]|nr:hypothetical protein MishRS11D_12060 [Methylomagnum ishizawai]
MDNIPPSHNAAHPHGQPRPRPFPEDRAMNPRSRSALSGLAAALSFAAAHAAPTENIFGAAGSLSLSGHFARPWRWLVVNQARLRADDPDGIRLSENLLLAQVGYDLTPYSSLWLGYLHDWAHPLDRPAHQENRPFQAYGFGQPWLAGRVTARLRLEERINQSTGDVGVRIRQSLQINYPLPWLRGLGAYLGDEVLVYANDSAFGQAGFSENRALAGLAYDFSPRLGLDLGYLGQYVSNPGQSDLFIHNLQTNLRYGF